MTFPNFLTIFALVLNCIVFVLVLWNFLRMLKQAKTIGWTRLRSQVHLNRLQKSFAELEETLAKKPYREPGAVATEEDWLEVEATNPPIVVRYTLRYDVSSQARVRVNGDTADGEDIFVANLPVHLFRHRNDEWYSFPEEEFEERMTDPRSTQ